MFETKSGLRKIATRSTAATITAFSLSAVLALGFSVGTAQAATAPKLPATVSYLKLRLATPTFKIA